MGVRPWLLPSVGGQAGCAHTLFRIKLPRLNNFSKLLLKPDKGAADRDLVLHCRRSRGPFAHAIPDGIGSSGGIEGNRRAGPPVDVRSRIFNNFEYGHVSEKTDCFLGAKPSPDDDSCLVVCRPECFVDSVVCRSVAVFCFRPREESLLGIEQCLFVGVGYRSVSRLGSEPRCAAEPSSGR